MNEDGRNVEMENKINKQIKKNQELNVSTWQPVPRHTTQTSGWSKNFDNS